MLLEVGVAHQVVQSRSVNQYTPVLSHVLTAYRLARRSLRIAEAAVEALVREAAAAPAAKPRQY